MKQLSFQNPLPLVYEAKNYFLHGGVSSLYKSLDSLFDGSGFRIALIRGPVASGKTHLAIKLADSFILKGHFVRILDGPQLPKFIKNDFDPATLEERDLIIVDDFDDYLKSIEDSEIGGFVSLVEALRVKQAGLILLGEVSDLEIDRLSPHISSRLRPATGFEILPPHYEELSVLLEIMARQRGLSLKGRRLDPVFKNVSRSIGALSEYLERLLYMSQVSGQSIKSPLITKASRLESL